FEFIIIDDGSTDGSRLLLAEYAKKDERVNVFHQTNRGLVSSLNRGAHLSRGTYIARMDADDIALPDRLERQVSYLEKHSNTVVLGGAVEMIDEVGQTIRYPQRPSSYMEVDAELLDRNVIWHPTVIMRRDMFMSSGGYRNVLAAEDYDLWLRLVERHRLENLPHIVLKYRVHSEQTTEKRSIQMTISDLSARAAAFSRRNGLADPLQDSRCIDSSLLAELARHVHPIRVDSLRNIEAGKDADQLRSYFRWILQVAEVNEDCMNAAIDALASNYWKQAERRSLAVANYTMARLQFTKKQYWRTAVTACNAALLDPLIIRRLFKPMQRFLQ
ncbi:MAG TPA: glycosyltransferase, partial [Bryobacteraceae bacterium]|nr:glycosyltransferase [Bryobacteraceae bacterium]